jgi:hypothetical protein
MTTFSTPAQVSAAPEPPGSTTVPDSSSEELTVAAADSVTDGRTRDRRPTHDPRHSLGLSRRDVAAVVFIALMGVLAQYQLHIHCFPAVSEVVVSRCVKRLRKRGLVDVLRWNRTGINLLKLTAAGRTFVVTYGGLAEKDMFAAKWPTPSALSHHLWVVDVRLALAIVIPTFDVLPCWALRRRFAGESVPVPDLLAVSRDGQRLYALEVDLGGENLRSVLVPKLQALTTATESWAPDARRAVSVFTVGTARAESLRRHAAAANLDLTVELLPDAIGRPAVDELVGVFRRL